MTNIIKEGELYGGFGMGRIGKLMKDGRYAMRTPYGFNKCNITFRVPVWDRIEKTNQQTIYFESVEKAKKILDAQDEIVQRFKVYTETVEYKKVAETVEKFDELLRDINGKLIGTYARTRLIKNESM